MSHDVVQDAIVPVSLHCSVGLVTCMSLASTPGYISDPIQLVNALQIPCVRNTKLIFTP